MPCSFLTFFLREIITVVLTDKSCFHCNMNMHTSVSSVPIKTERHGNCKEIAFKMSSFSRNQITTAMLNVNPPVVFIKRHQKYCFLV